MSWIDRLRQAAYTSPSGVRILFTYEDVSQTIDKLTTAYQFPDGDATFVQDLGKSGRRFPLRVIFWGDDYDQEAAGFEEALSERGRGVLEHPVYGTRNVVPFGRIERSDSLKSAANQAVIQVTFWESTESVFLEDQTATEDVARENLETFNTDSAESFEERANVETATERATFREQMRSAINSVRSGLRVIADQTEEIQRQFDSVFNSIDSGLDLLIGTPLTLAFQFLILVETPARSAALISDKIDAYQNLADDVLSRAVPVLGLDNTAKNEFLALDTTAQAAVAGLALSSLETEYRSQPEAIEAADALAALMVEFTDWRDPGFASVGDIDTGEAYKALQDLVSATLASLVDIALQLPQERSVTLDRARNIVELVAELYGEIDPRLDEFIDLNGLTGDEILELPLGKRIVYYV